MDTFDSSSSSGSENRFLSEIFEYVNSTEGLRFSESDLSDYFIIEQVVDKHCIKINKFDVKDVMVRRDENNNEFLQVSFVSGKKVLLTEKLVGFRPVSLFGLDMNRLPRVVTTPDVMSIFDAIQEILCDELHSLEELEVLRKVYDSVVCGGESVGFDMSVERKLFSRIPTQIFPSVV